MSIISRIFRADRRTNKAAGQGEINPALEFIKSVPQDLITETLVAAFRRICDGLLSEAEKSASAIGLNDPLFVECIVDLELAGGFDTIVDFTSDKALASAFADAVVFDLTCKDPSLVPGEIEFHFGGTEKYRGVAKYAMAKTYFDLPSPKGHLFGKEYAQIRTGNALNLGEIAMGSAAATFILETGRSIFRHFLFDLFFEWDTPSACGKQETINLEQLNAAVGARREQARKKV